MTMSEDQAEEGDDALAREAAHWFARMRGPDADASRAEFEAWLAQGPEHRVAYNDAAEIFALGKLLAEPDAPAPRPAPARRRGVLAAALATVTTCAVGIGGWAALHRSGPDAHGHEALAVMADHRRVSTLAGEGRVVRLADGSTVRLGDATILDVDIGTGQRDLRLVRGQARFEVAHERRPFIVYAGGGSVTARGTIFEVALTRPGKVDVRLLQGAVDVALPRAPASPRPPIRKLVAGEGVTFVALPDAPATPVAPSDAGAAPSAAAREFQAVPLAELISLANRGSARPIRLADISLAGQRVSGRFRIDDTEVVAKRLGALFGLEVEARDPGELVLARPAGGPAPADARRQPLSGTRP